MLAKRSPNPIVKTALLQTTSTKSTSREEGDNIHEQFLLSILDIPYIAIRNGIEDVKSRA